MAGLGRAPGQGAAPQPPGSILATESCFLKLSFRQTSEGSRCWFAWLQSALQQIYVGHTAVTGK